jgi:hypothetical protein
LNQAGFRLCLPYWLGHLGQVLLWASVFLISNLPAWVAVRLEWHKLSETDIKVIDTQRLTMCLWQNYNYYIYHIFIVKPTSYWTKTPANETF